MTSYPLGKSRRLWIGILVPNNDLLEHLTQLRMHLLAATLVTLLTALAYSFLLARSYSRPLEALAAQSRRIRDLDFQTDAKIEAKLREFKQLGEAQAQSLAALQSFSRYVPLEIVKELVAKGEVARIGGHTENLTILFTDIAAFTNISEAMSPEALTNHLAGYFQAMIDTLHHHGATVDKIVGDAVVAFWGAPTPMPDQADRAVKAVLECRDTLEELNANLAGPGPAGAAHPVRPGHRPGGGGQYGGPDPTGLHGAGGHGESGQPPGRPEQGLRHRHLGGYRHPAGLEDGYAWRHLDRIIVVGKTQATDIFEVLGETGQVPKVRLAAARRYEAAWEHYRAGDFHRALSELAGFEAEFGPDLAVAAPAANLRGLPAVPAGRRLGRDFYNDDQMRRRLRKCRGPARKGGRPWQRSG